MAKKQASHFRESEIVWDDETYTFKPTLDLICAIERSGISIMYVDQMLRTGQPVAALMSRVMAMCLQSAGASVDEGEIYAEFNSAAAGDVFPVYVAIMAALLPDVSKKKEKPQDTDE